jgi:hypothetical protein
MPALLQFILAHQGDSADPELLHWIKDRLDQIVGAGPWLIVGVIIAIMVAIPLSIVLFYLIQQRRQRSAVRKPSPDEP